jgi:hypothetical protein
MIVTCERCFSADEVTWQPLPDRMVTPARPRTAAAARTPSPGRSPGSPRPSRKGRAGSPTTCWIRCCRASSPEPLLEYGIVEYRLRQRFPRLFQEHVAERGHVLTGATLATASSVRFGVGLGRLAADGQLVSVYGPATGAWKYNGEVTYWATPKAPTQEVVGRVLRGDRPGPTVAGPGSTGAAPRAVARSGNPST